MANKIIQISAQVLNSIPIVLPVTNQANLTRDEFGYQNVEVINSDEIQDKSAVTGAPVFMPLNFDPCTYTDEDGKVSLNGLYVPCCIIEVTGTKNIQKTPIAGTGKNGTVKEYINFGDYAISIKGLLVGKGDQYPADQVRKLHQYIRCNTEIGVTHDIFKMLGIYYLVIESFSLPNKQGFQNVQPFELNCCSDRPIQLTIKAS